MAGNIHYPYPSLVRQIKVGEAELYRDAPFLLLLTPICIDTGERLHELGLAVVYMPRRAKHKRYARS